MVEMGANGRLSERRIKVAVVNDYELVVQGVATMLRAFRDRIEVVEVDVRENPHGEVDVALFDTYGHRQLGLDRVAALVRDPNVGAVAVYTGHSTSDQRDAVLAAGARGLLAKSMQAERAGGSPDRHRRGPIRSSAKSSATPKMRIGRVTSSASRHGRVRSPRCSRKA